MLKRLQYDLVFLLLFGSLCVLYYDSVLDKGPLSSHLWRQADCLSFTRNFADGAPFFEPSLNHLLADGYTTGKSAGELPLLYYGVGQWWKYFGESYLSYRLIWLGLVLMGLFSLFKALQLILEDNFWALIAALGLFTSPVFVFYGVSFLTDVPGFCFALLGTSALLHWRVQGKSVLFWLGFSALLLAGLLKVSMLIPFVFLLGIFALERLSLKTLSGQYLWANTSRNWLAFSMLIGITVAWYAYASNYSASHNFRYTFNSVYPFYEMGTEQVQVLLFDLVNFASLVFFSRPMILLLLLCLLFVSFHWKKVPLFVALMPVVIALGCLMYFLLWAPLMGVHDYYYSAMLVLYTSLVPAALWTLKSKYSGIFKNAWVKGAALAFLVYNVGYCSSVMQLKTNGKQELFSWVSNQHFIETCEYANWDMKANWWRLEEMIPYNRSLGITREDKVIFLPDASFNASLFLLDQKGWSNYLNFQKSEDIQALIGNGASYLFIGQQDWLEKDFLQPFLHEPVGEFKGVYVYRLDSKNTPR